MAENKVSVELTVEEKAAEKALESFVKKVLKVETQAISMGNSGDDSFKKIAKSANSSENSVKSFSSQLSEGASSGFGELVKGVTIANLASSAILGVGGALKSFVLDSLEAAQGQEEAINRLNQALRASGDFSEETSLDFQRYSSEMQQVSIFGDEVVLGQIAVAKSFGATNEQAKQLVQAAANLSATFGGTLEQNVEKLGKTFSGEAGRLAQYIPEIKNLTQEQLKAGSAFEIVNRKYDGAAANELATYKGQVTAMANAYSDLQEELGLFVTTSSAASGVNSVLKGIFEELGAELKAYRIEVSRGTEGFKENQESVNQLSDEYAELTTKIENARNILAQEADPNTGFFKSLFLNTVKAKEDIRELSILQARLLEQINTAQAESSANETTSSGGSKGITSEDQRKIDSRNLANATLMQIQLEYAAWEAEQSLMAREITTENYQAELEQLIALETEKINAKYLAEEEKNKVIEDAQTRRITQEATAEKKSLEIAKASFDAKKRIDQQQIQLEQQKQAAILGIMGASANLASVIAKDGSREQFLIQKAAALAQAIVATNTAAALALAVPPAPNVGLAAYAKAAGAINIAAIVASSIKGYATGGFVDSSSKVGDRNLIRVNGDETVFTARQTSRILTEIANGGSTDGGLAEKINMLIDEIRNQPIVLRVDERELARSVRNQVNGGFKLI